MELYLDGFENLFTAFDQHGLELADILFTPLDSSNNIDSSSSEFSLTSNGGQFQLLVLDTLEFIIRNIDKYEELESRPRKGVKADEEVVRGKVREVER